jgi:predicted O-linked N-acetylglucosamine transferase (SPINDLY family)
LIFALDFDAATTAAEAFAERRRWDAAHALPLARHAVPHANDPTPDRRLRIGYVSADFRRHSAATVFGPVVLSHDRERFEVVCYAGRRGPDDETTARFRDAATLWRPTSGVPDMALARQIREDAIDILVDLSGHTGGHRLKVFAQRPAPVQMTAWGHALGTGLDAIDYFFADRVTVPGEARRYFSEAVVDLPAFVPYSPTVPSPDVTPLPALERGSVTLGCFNRLAKVTTEMVGLWAAILREVAGARLLMKFHGLEHGAVQERIRTVIAEYGVDGARIEFMGGSTAVEHLAAYEQVDLALDPFPHGGGVTALDGLWMGVPMVTLAGERIPSRMGASILTTLGLEAFIARTPDEYVAVAIRQARDLPRLAALRARLRERLTASIICDHRAYCRAVEESYRAMWKRWCESRPR